MNWRNTAERYGWVAQLLHWAVVAGIAAAWLLAETAEDDDSGRLLDLHRSIGLTILALALVRVAWRLIDRTPPWPRTMAGWERAMAASAHALFYLLLFALPVTGWLLSGAEGQVVTWFGWVELPAIGTGPDEDTLEDVHEFLFNGLLALTALHVTAAMKHHFWDRDRVLTGMLPATRGRSP
jgi:cytochrome b561